MTQTPRKQGSLPTAYFDALYAADADPWRFETSPYEREKYAATLAALPRSRYGNALEVGCSIGVLTAALAPRCERLLAIDAAAAPLGVARRRCAALGQVAFRQARVPEEWPESSAGYDLLLFSEVLYYLVRADLDRLAARIRASAAPGADLLLVHWTEATDYPLSGDDAAEHFIVALSGAAAVTAQQRAGSYRLDRLRVA